MLWLCLSEGAYSKPLAVLPSTLSQKNRLVRHVGSLEVATITRL